MKKKLRYISIVISLGLGSCQDVLQPKPNNILSSDIVLTSPDDIPQVRVGLYGALRSTASLSVVAGDLTADLAVHNGTFTVYNELSNKQIPSSNSAAGSLWGGLYRLVYISNFIQERLPQLTSVPASRRNALVAECRLLRGYAYFVAAHTYGGTPLVTTTDITTNQNIPRTSKEDVLAFALKDITDAIPALPDTALAGAGYATRHTARAMLARYYLYQKDWINAEKYATQVIASRQFELESSYATIVNVDFTRESILEVGYTTADDPGTSTFGLNNIFVGRREVIPANSFVFQLFGPEVGDRLQTVTFDSKNQRGNDNGFSVAKYGTADANNNNIVLFRLAEMYLIRAEARAQQNKLTDAVADINVLRKRAKAIQMNVASQAEVLLAVERERLYELAFEGHRWYDLVRTGRARAVMSAYSQNWKDTYERWPIPLGEMQRNPALNGNQNPGY